MLIKLQGVSKNIIKMPQRNFPRGIYKEQMLERNRSHKLKPLDSERAHRMKQADSLKELEFMKQGDVQYQQFVAESVQDPEVEKQMDQLIEEQMALGKTDEEIIQYLSGVTGLQNSQQLTREDVDRYEAQKMAQIEQKLLARGEKIPSTDAIGFEGMDDLHEFQDKTGYMMAETDRILQKTWEQEEKQRRLAERQTKGPAVSIDKRQRQLEPTSKFGNFKTETEQVVLPAKSQDNNLSIKDEEFARLVTQDEQEEHMGLKQNFDERDNEIVGKQVERAENLSTPSRQKLTVQQKVKKELKYLTEALDLDPAQQKHWYYKLKREYEAQQKLEKRIEQKQAKKDYRKLLKKYGIGNDLEQIDDYDAYYNKTNDNQEKEERQDDNDQYFQNEAERIFYDEGRDIDFVRYHKRSTRNFQEALQQIIDSSKQTVAKGISNQHRITVNYLKLNKACTVVTCWWQLNIIPAELVSEDFRQFQIETEQEFIKEQLTKHVGQEEQGEFDEEVKTPTDFLVQRDKEQIAIIEAEIQKKLTKAAAYFSGKLVRSLGLRYAPEIRFYRDNTFELLQNYQKQAEKYLEEAKKEEDDNQARKEGGPTGMLADISKPLEGLQQFLSQMKDLQPEQRHMMLQQIEDPDEQEAFKQLLDVKKFETMQEELEQTLQKMREASLESSTRMEKEFKETRMGRRQQRELDQWKGLISEAGDIDFDEVTGRNMSPKEIDQSLTGIAAEIQPTVPGSKKDEKFSFNPITGEKVRHEKKLPRKLSKKESKSQRRLRKQQEFWANL